MIVMTTTLFSPESAKEVGKRFMESSALPDYITRRGPYILPTKEEGIQGITIYEVDRPSKIAEAVEWTANDVTKYFGIPGFTYSITVCLDAEEALKTIGL
jgi:hypothetical protein